MSLALNTKHLSSFINEEEYKAIYPQVEAAHKTLEADVYKRQLSRMAFRSPLPQTRSASMNWAASSGKACG